MKWLLGPGFGLGPVPRPLAVLLAGLAAAAMIYALLQLQSASHLAWIIPSFGASCALVFGVPDSPFARPASVIGGHLVSSLVGLVVMAALGHGPLAMAVGVGCAIAAMMVTRTMHPPAGGDPLIVIATAAAPTFLLTPVLVGTIAISLAGFAFRQLRTQRPG
jgi:CBS-domain-containing membrane protein